MEPDLRPSGGGQRTERVQVRAPATSRRLHQHLIAAASLVLLINLLPFNLISKPGTGSQLFTAQARPPSPHGISSNQQTRTQQQQQQQHSRAPVLLDEATWTRVLDGEWMLLATANWCQVCKRIEPEWRQLAEMSADEDHNHLNLMIGTLDLTSNSPMSARFQVRQLPTIFHVKEGVFRHYPGPRDHISLMRFVQEQSWKMLEPLSLTFNRPPAPAPQGPSASQHVALPSGSTPNKPQAQQTSNQQALQMQYQVNNLHQQQLQASINNPYTNATHMLLLDLRQQLITRALKFDENFRSLLTKSKVSLHNMFVATYGLMYEHNTEIFTSMYESLEQYYATGQVKLTKSMENFFERLYQKIFQVVNTNRAFPPNYLECATEQLAHLKPFRDAPEKLIADIRHALVAARTFNQALNSGIDIIKSIISVSSNFRCLFSFSKFERCSNM